jgi:hypothetical protein
VGAVAQDLHRAASHRGVREMTPCLLVARGDAGERHGFMFNPADNGVRRGRLKAKIIGRDHAECKDGSRGVSLRRVLLLKRENAVPAGETLSLDLGHRGLRIALRQFSLAKDGSEAKEKAGHQAAFLSRCRA